MKDAQIRLLDPRKTSQELDHLRTIANFKKLPKTVLRFQLKKYEKTGVNFGITKKNSSGKMHNSINILQFLIISMHLENTYKFLFMMKIVSSNYFFENKVSVSINVYNLVYIEISYF